MPILAHKKNTIKSSKFKPLREKGGSYYLPIVGYRLLPLARPYFSRIRIELRQNLNEAPDTAALLLSGLSKSFVNTNTCSFLMLDKCQLVNSNARETGKTTNFWFTMNYHLVRTIAYKWASTYSSTWRRRSFTSTGTFGTLPKI